MLVSCRTTIQRALRVLQLVIQVVLLAVRRLVLVVWVRYGGPDRVVVYQVKGRRKKMKNLHTSCDFMANSIISGLKRETQNIPLREFLSEFWRIRSIRKRFYNENWSWLLLEGTWSSSNSSILII